ncbi:lebercilin-like protein [Tiliqua scincoides]|uniref:lebercilin-like protein n=1 Tax=Tiliqua scincoides TaxID=71010 RepID=UPI0034633222
MYPRNRMKSSDGSFLHFMVQEDNKCDHCTNSRSPGDSPRRINKGTQCHSHNEINNCSECTSRCGSFQLDYSNDFHANASRKGKRSSSSSSCSEQNNCGSSQNYYYEDFHTNSSETSSGNSRSCSFHSHVEQPESKEEELSKEENDRQVKGSRMLPKKKQQPKTLFGTSGITNSQKSSNMTRRILSARLHKIKELKNEVSVLQNKLEASNMENQLLKRLQHRHLKAIGKYENAETNLPDLMAKHYGEVRTLRALLRKSQEQERSASRKLREVEAQLLKTKDTLQALQKLSEDKNLAERADLKHKLTILSEKMEASDKKIQGLEKQLLLNNTSFSHQLAVEKKKSLEAWTISTNLQMEIKSLNQKIKEKERELGIRNIYANRMLKGQQDKGDTEQKSPPNQMLKGQRDKGDTEQKSPPKDVNVTRSEQVDMSFELEAVTPVQKQEQEKSAVLKKEMTSKDTNLRNKQCDAHQVVHQAEVHQTEKLLMQQLSNRTCTELLREEIRLSEEKHFKCENLERLKKRRDGQGINLLKDEFEKLRTVQSFPLTHSILQKENNMEERKKQENEECKRSIEPKEAVAGKLAVLTQRHKTPSKLKKQYVFSEVIENLHQGVPTSGPTSNTSIVCNSKQVTRHQSEIVEFNTGNSTSAYEPSFGKATKTRQKGPSSVHGEDDVSMISAEKKNTLMEELFGSNCIIKDSHSSPNLKEVVKEKNTLPSKRISCINDSLQYSNSKQTQIKVFHTIASLEDLK